MNSDCPNKLMLGDFIMRLKVLLETCGDAPVTVCLGESEKGSLVQGISEVAVACSQVDCSMSYILRVGDYAAAFDGETITLERKRKGV